MPVLDLLPLMVMPEDCRCRGPQAARHGLCHCTDKLLVFLKRRDVEPTNNESERALRPSAIFRKVTNGFRSKWGAKTYAALCSIVKTGRRNGRSALTAIRDALAVPTPEPTAA